MACEEALTFACGEDILLGVLSRPAQSVGDLGVLIVVGGPQYRAGSHRQFVLLARHLAAAGIPVLRFDVRGMGDSEGEAREFTAIDDDIAAAMTALESACPSVRRIVLWGLCDGASAALLYWQRCGDVRVAGMVLVNPWVRSEAGLARARVRHYYRERLLQKEFWWKLARGRFAPWRALRDGVYNWRLARASAEIPDASFQAQMAVALREFPGALLIVLSDSDVTAQEFADWLGVIMPDWRQRTGWSCRSIADADHTFSSVRSKQELERAMVDWLQENLPSPKF